MVPFGVRCGHRAFPLLTCILKKTVLQRVYRDPQPRLPGLGGFGSVSDLQLSPSAGTVPAVFKQLSNINSVPEHRIGNVLTIIVLSYS